MIDSQQFNQQFLDGNAPELAKTYLFFGQTPFLSLESAQIFVDYAKEKGFTQREIYYLNNKSKSLRPILDSLQSPGLFDPKKIIELRFETDKPSEKLGEQVATIAKHDSVNLVIIEASGIGYAYQKKKWFGNLQKVATCIASKPIYASQLPNWIHQRATKLNLKLETDALKIVMRYSEGNLLWTNQILMQLSNSDYPQPIKAAVIEDILADMSIFHVDDLTQAILNKQPQAIRITQKLESENEPVTMITAFLQKEISTLLALMQSGEPFDQACRTLRIWSNKQRGYQAALNHYSETQLCEALQKFAKLDRMNKGIEYGGDKGGDWVLLTHIVSNLVTA